MRCGDSPKSKQIFILPFTFCSNRQNSTLTMLRTGVLAAQGATDTSFGWFADPINEGHLPSLAQDARWPPSCKTSPLRSFLSLGTSRAFEAEHPH